MGFNMLLYIIFGTNLLTEGLVPVSDFFSYFRVLQKRNTKRSPNGMKPSRWTFLDRKQTRRHGVEVWNSARKPRGRRARPGGCCAPTLMGPSELHQRTSFAYIYSYTLKTSRGATKPCFHRRNLMYSWDPILGPFPAICRRGNRSRRASTSTPWPLWWCVSSLPQNFGSIVIS